MTPEPVAAAVVVTYGDRAPFVIRCVAALRAQTSPPERILVVYNGVEPKLSADEAEAVPLADNTGSAGGFAAGIATALQDPDVTHVWLHDDDALPRPDALEAITRHARLAPERIYVSLREDRSTYARMAAGASERDVFAPPWAVAGFDLGRAVTRRLTRERHAEVSTAWLPVAPYGGMFVPRAAVDRAGGPDPRFFTYADDHEWSRRLRRAGHPIELVVDSRVGDQDGAGRTGTAGRVDALTRPGPDGLARSVLAVRNTAFVAFRCSPVRCVVNVLALMLVVSCRSPTSFGRVVVLLRAAWEGIRGRLGPDLPVDWRGNRGSAPSLLSGGTTG